METQLLGSPFALGLLLMLVGLVGVFVPFMPGIPVMLLGAFIYSWLTDFDILTWPWLTLLSLLTIASLVVDFLAAAWVSRKMGASRPGAGGALVGGLIGIVLFGAWGALLGGVGGAVAGDLLVNRPLRAALRSGTGAVIGFAIALLADLFFGLSILGIYLLIAR